MNANAKAQMEATQEALKVMRRMQDLGVLSGPRVYVRTQPKPNAKILWR